MTNTIAEKIINLIAPSISSDEFSSAHWNFFNRDKKISPSNLINFRSSGLSLGLDDSHTVENLPALIIDVLEQVSVDQLISSLPKTNVGNSPYSIKTSQGYINGNDLFFAVWLSQLRSVCGPNPTHILEIGGGYGGFARTIINSLPKLTSYTLIELPVSAMLATYYAHESTDCGIYFNGIQVRQAMGMPVINIYTPDFDLDRHPNQFDIVINTRSMMEMNLNVIDFYFDYIHQTIKPNGTFLNINRYLKSTSGDVVRICDFPYDDHWDLLLSEPSFRQNRIHCLIAKRLNQDSSGTLQAELHAIAQLPQSATPPNYKLETLTSTTYARWRLKSLVMHLLTQIITLIPIRLRKKIGRLLLAAN